MAVRVARSDRSTGGCGSGRRPTPRSERSHAFPVACCPESCSTEPPRGIPRCLRHLRSSRRWRTMTRISASDVFSSTARQEKAPASAAFRRHRASASSRSMRCRRQPRLPMPRRRRTPPGRWPSATRATSDRAGRCKPSTCSAESWITDCAQRGRLRCVATGLSVGARVARRSSSGRDRSSSRASDTEADPCDGMARARSCAERRSGRSSNSASWRSRGAFSPGTLTRDRLICGA